MANETSNEWIEWNGDASTIPAAIGWVQFGHETREQALLREPSRIDYWPWFGEDEKPDVRAYRVVSA